MRAGRLRHRVALQSPTESRGAAGGVTKTFATQATVWGGIEPLSGKEYLAIQQTQNEATVRIVIRYRSDVDETWRIVHGGLAYSILSIINESTRGRMLTIMCSEGVKEETGVPSALLLESGDSLLLEDSGVLLQE